MRTGWFSLRGGLTAVAILLLGVAACEPLPPEEPLAAASPAAVAPPAPVAEPVPPQAPPVAAVEPAASTKQMIAAAHPLAAEAGLAMLKAGGSAIDAAIAAELVLGLVEPQSSGIGGGAFLMHYAAKTGEIAAYDGRETAPAAATSDMFLNADGRPMAFEKAVVGGLSVGVPGFLRMAEMAHREHGRLPWAQLFDPAIGLAEKGFAVSERLHGLIAGAKHLKTFAATAGYFHGPDGQPRAAGEIVANPAYAATLREVAEKGAEAFYTGPIASDIAAAARGARPNPGRMVAADLAGYKAIKREPVCLFYRAWMVCGMPAPTSGGITTLQILGLLQGTDLAALKPNSVEAVHLIAEASRLAFADRDTYIADPAFIPVPAAGMLDSGYLKLRAREISPTRSMGTAFPGMPGTGGAWNFAPDDTRTGVSTTHLAVIDADGNAVSLTASIEGPFGSHLMARGFLLNNQLTDFSFAPVKGGAPVANAVEPKKRPRSSMAPMLVFDGTGRVVEAVGSPGGSRIIGYVAKTLIATLDWKMDIQAAIDLPNFVNRNGKTELEKGTPLEALAPALKALGHEVTIGEMTSGLHGVTADATGLAGGADPRRDGVALGQ
ncbi:gamma-glutamyltransferase [Shumkonia mesophila]|uniref:gamma-glutamyltransferase n=1 Tax=Shumkonia mesophila TaxID=2838854 RepID=UPI002934DA43|nr:gamma-glutamyltransferase [Shumkonia mesophila]